MARIEWDSGGTTVAVELDVTEREGYEATAEVTAHSVEEGSDISDHVRRNPDGFTLEGWVTNDPIVVPSTQMGGVTGAVQAGTITVAGKPLRASTLRWSGPFNRVQVVDSLLAALVGAQQVMRLITRLRFEDNVVLTRYKVDRDASTGNALAVTLELRRVRIVTTRRVAVPAVRRGQSQANRGGQAGADTGPPTSALAHIFGVH